jgi:hypothetical protein
MGLSPELSHEFYRIRSMHKFKIPEEEQRAYVNLTLEIKDGTVDEVIKQIDTLIADFPEEFKSVFSYAGEGHNKLSLALCPPLNVDEHIEPFKDVMGKVQEELKVD